MYLLGRFCIVTAIILIFSESALIIDIETLRSIIYHYNESGLCKFAHYNCIIQFTVVSKPLNAVSTYVTTNSTSVEWDPPAEPGGQIWAYKLTVSNVTGETETCVQEVILQCSTCNVSV